MPRKKFRTARRKAKAKPTAPAAPKDTQTKRKQWSEESMTAALDEFKKGKHSINKIAVLYGVPKSTLHDRISGRVEHGTKSGPRPYLDAEEERQLANHLVKVAKLGYGKTRKEVKMIAENVAKDKGVLRCTRISDGWWKSFLHRQQCLSLRRADSTAHIRMDSVNNQSIQQYYDLLEETMVTHNIKKCPHQIYNMDETGMPLTPRTPNIVTHSGQKKVRYRTSGKKEQITVIACANAAGQAIPPMIIFEGKYLNHEWTIGEVPGTKYGMSEKGWTDQELFMYWLKHFLDHAVPARPLLLLLDGHSSHFELSSIQLAEEEGVIILCLPPHTTHESQPLDCGVFGPLKKQWTQVCHDFQQENKGAVISKYSFSSLFSKAWLQALSVCNIVAGFRKCGVYPFNRNAIEIIDNDPTDDSGIDLNHSCDDTPESEPPHKTNKESVPTQSLTEQNILLFQRRFEEGYDLYDPLYQKWLELEHPEAARSHNLESSILNFFPEAPIVNPVEITDDSGYPRDSTKLVNETQTSTSVLPASTEATESLNETEPLTPNLPASTETTEPLNQAESSTFKLPASTVAIESAESPISSLPASTVAASNTQCTNSLSVKHKETVSNKSGHSTTVLSKYLNTPTITKPKPSTRAITTARVLTSAECLDIIREKEMKRKAEEEAKQQRKREREEKKKKAEEEKQRKIEERKKKLAEKAENARKAAEEKAEKAKRAAEAKAHRLAEQERRLAERVRRAEEKRAAQTNDEELHVTSPTDEETSNMQRSGKKRNADSRSSASSAAKRKYPGETEASSENENQCCVCFELYDIQQGEVVWVQCSCKRWLHEDCVIDAIKDADGKIRLCPYCLT